MNNIPVPKDEHRQNKFEKYKLPSIADNSLRSRKELAKQEYCRIRYKWDEKHKLRRKTKDKKLHKNDEKQIILRYSSFGQKR